jgi:hypothetical protein
VASQRPGDERCVVDDVAQLVPALGCPTPGGTDANAAGSASSASRRPASGWAVGTTGTAAGGAAGSGEPSVPPATPMSSGRDQALTSDVEGAPADGFWPSSAAIQCFSGWAALTR